MKIIKIRTCYECPFIAKNVYWDNTNNEMESAYWCANLHLDLGEGLIKIDKKWNIVNEIVWDGNIPQECPLEDEK